MMQKLAFEKSGDALSSEAQAPGLGFITGLGGLLANTIMKKHYGGSWVSGTLTTDGDWLSFIPGIASILYYTNTEEVKIHFSEIRQIRHESGLIKDTIVILYARGEFKFRCFGAAELASTLNSYLQYIQSFNNPNSFR
ncbi:MAG TPA: hypothetical protein PKY82_33395 [Pyrinomonadaceae bacterium]|nr:hypothetical protein [Pyrinomonadaceae bacterium]